MNKPHCLTTLIIFLLLSDASFGSPRNDSPMISIIPRPAKVVRGTGNLKLTENTWILFDGAAEEVAAIARGAASKLRVATGYSIHLGTPGDSNDDVITIGLTLDQAGEGLGQEGYRLVVEDSSIAIVAHKPAGLFYGVQTLYQLLPAQVESAGGNNGTEWSVPRVSIEDKPRFVWRGMHLDVGRHLFSVEFIKKFLDLLAYHKMNTFHWHLTEDQGWRIEIKKYPRLTEVGAYRDQTLVGHYRDQPHKFDGKRYGGFYTQHEIRDIVRYAQERYITVVPEIEMPGHSVAALATYPQLSCTGESLKVSGIWGVHEDIYCAGNDSVFAFLEDVLSEVLALFPSKTIHIGGDEAPKARWKACAKCQARIEREGLRDEQELQSYFIGRIERFLNARGRRLIGWDEILEGGLAPNAAVMSWRGMKGGMAAADAGHDVVMSPNSHCYFDHYQARQGEPLAIGGFLPLRKVYSFDPIPPRLSLEKQEHILGAQGNVWTEYITTPEYAEYMTVPRMCAMAEVVWSPKVARNYGDFQARMVKHYDRLARRGINYRRNTGGDKHVLIIGIDGALVAGVQAADTPNLDSLVANGVVTWNAYAGGELGTPTQQATSSGPGWSSILTGVWVDKHNVSNNDFKNPHYDRYPHFFTRIRESRPGAYLSSIVHWKPIHKRILSDADFQAVGNDAAVARKAVHHLLNADPDVLFLHFDELDGAGHHSGYSAANPKYTAMVSKIDEHIGTVLRGLRSRKNYDREDWLVIVTTDHGGRGKGHGGQEPEVRRIFLIVSGKNTARGEIKDGPGHVAVPPTVLGHLGIEVKPEWGWESTAFGLID